jgi:hypothetical protein
MIECHEYVPETLLVEMKSELHNASTSTINKLFKLWVIKTRRIIFTDYHNDKKITNNFTKLLFHKPLI